MEFLSKVQSTTQSEISNNDFSVSIQRTDYDQPYKVYVEPDACFRVGIPLRPSSRYTLNLVGVGVDDLVDGTAPLCVPPDVAMHATVEGPGRNFVLRFSKSCFHRLTGHSGDLSRAELLASLRIMDKSVAYTINRLVVELENPGLASTILVESLCTTLIVDLHRYLIHANKEDERRLAGLSRRQISLIDDRSYQDGPAPGIAELARICDLSERQLIRLFKRSTGLTIHTYVEDVRLKRAIELLSSTNLGLKEIAFRLGFSAPSGFSNAFRRLTGVSPSLYRQAIRLSRHH